MNRRKAAVRHNAEELTVEERIITFRGAAFKALRKYFPTYADDEDFQQMAMIGLWKAAKGFDPSRGEFTTLVFQAVRNEILHHFAGVNRQRRQGAADVISLYDDAARDYEKSWLDVTAANRGPEWVDFEGFLGALSPKLRQIVLWRMAGYTLEECGQMLGGVSRESVRQQMSKARTVFERYV